MYDQTKKATEVKQRYEKKWLGIRGVTAIGLGQIDDNIGIIISVDNITEIEQAQIPAQVEGIPIEIKLTGKLRAL